MLRGSYLTEGHNVNYIKTQTNGQSYGPKTKVYTDINNLSEGSYGVYDLVNDQKVSCHFATP